MIHIPIKSGPIELRIRGIREGTNQDVLAQVNRGARLILYRYAIAFVVLSFLRPSDVFCVPPGRNRIIPGLRYSLLSLVAGWWSLPSGIVFTLKALFRNFCGGVDVTDKVVAILVEAPAGAPARVVLHDEKFTFPSATPPAAHDPARAEAAAAYRRLNVKFCLWMGAFFLVAITATLTYRATHYPLAAVNGTQYAYTLVLDGKDVPLVSNGVQTLEVTVGRHSAHALLPDGSTRTIEFETGVDWYDPRTPRSCAVVNLDRLAVIVERHQLYGEATPTAVVPPPRAWASHDVVTLRNPAFFFADFPRSIESREGSKDVMRTQIMLFPSLSAEERVRVLAAYGNREDLEAYRALVAADTVKVR